MSKVRDMTPIINFNDWASQKRKALLADEEFRIECASCKGTGVQLVTDCECPNCDGHEGDCYVCAMEGMIKFSDASNVDQEKLLRELYRKAVFDDLKALSEWTSDFQILANKGYHLYSKFEPNRFTGHKDQRCIDQAGNDFIVQRHCH